MEMEVKLDVESPVGCPHVDHSYAARAKVRLSLFL